MRRLCSIALVLAACSHGTEDVSPDAHVVELGIDLASHDGEALTDLGIDADTDGSTPSVPAGAVDVPLPAACASATTMCAADGMTDDAACLQKLLDQGGTVVLPEKRSFALKSKLRVSANTTLVGCGSTLTLSQPDVVLAIQGSGVTVDGVQLVYTGTTKVGGIIDLSAGVSNLTVKNCTTQGGQDAVASLQINNVQISHVTITNNRFNGGDFGVLFNTTNFTAAELPVLANHPYDVLIDHNTIRGVLADAIEVNSAVHDFMPHNSGTEGVAAHDIQITNNDVQASLANQSSGGFCVGVAGGFNVTIADNVMNECKWQFIHLEDAANGIVIEHNTMKTNIGPKPADKSTWAAGDSSGIILLAVDHITILDNEIDACIGDGIEQSFNGTDYDSHVTMSGNTIDGAGTDCIFVGGAGGQDLATLIGPSTYDGTSYGGNTAKACTGMAVKKGGTALDVTVTGNVNF